MSAFAWVLNSPDGSQLRTTEVFDSKGQAEEWMGDNWSDLADEGAETVSLMSGSEVIYTMSLKPA